MQTSSQHPYALPGDLLFVLKARKHIPIETAGRMTKRPNPHILHAATVVTTDDVVEATFRKLAYCVRLRDWRAAGAQGNRYVVLRQPDSNNQIKMQSMINAATYYLNEEYALRDVIIDVFVPQPEKAGRSICSMLAAKILRRAKVVDQKQLPLRRQLYPGELFALLKGLGWVEISTDDGKYFSGIASQLSLSPMELKSSMTEHFNLIESAFGDTWKLARSKIKAIQKVPDDCLIFSFAMKSDYSVFKYSREILKIGIVDVCMIAQKQARQPENWKDEAAHVSEDHEALDEAYAIIQSALRLLNLFLAKLAKIADVISVIEIDRIEAAEAWPNERLSCIKAALMAHAEADMKFFLLTGQPAAEFLRDWAPASLLWLDVWPVEGDVERASVEPLVRELWEEASGQLEEVQKCAVMTAESIIRIDAVLKAHVDQETLDDVRQFVHEFFGRTRAITRYLNRSTTTS